MQAIDQWGAEHYDGYAVQAWMASHVDVCVYIATAYLFFVFRAPDFMEKYCPPNKVSNWIVKKVWTLWNVLLSIFSLYGASRVLPALIDNIRESSTHERPVYDLICTFKPEQFYTTPVGFAMGLFTLSKCPEFLDTVFLILRGKGKSLPFLQWFHHVTTFLFTWFAYQVGSSVFIFAAAMNYSVHTIMYFYFAMTEAGFKNLVKPFAMYITLLQISQMIVGMLVSFCVVYFKVTAIANGQDHHSVCTGTSFSYGRTQLIIYICNFYLFAEMFVKGYVVKSNRSAHAK